jgi:hypothetical protein
VNFVDPDGLELTRADVVNAYKLAYGEDDPVLMAYLKAGHDIFTGDIWRDQRYDFNLWGTKKYHISIEEDLDNPFIAAAHLRRQLARVFSAAQTENQLTSNVFFDEMHAWANNNALRASQKGGGGGGLFDFQNYINATQVQGLAELGTKIDHVGTIAVSIVPGVGDGADFAIALDALNERDFITAGLAALPLVPAAVVGARSVRVALKTGDTALEFTEDALRVYNALSEAQKKKLLELAKGKAHDATSVLKLIQDVAPRPQQIAYGSSDLGQIVIQARRQTSTFSARNAAVVEYRAADNSLRTMTTFSERGVGHAERLLAKDLDAIGVHPSQVTRIYTELEPCSVPGGYCKDFIRQTYPQAEVTYSFQYGADILSRRAGVDALSEAAGRLRNTGN